VRMETSVRAMVRQNGRKETNGQARVLRESGDNDALPLCSVYE